ncbi:hypothetical protein JCM3774_000574 [Rhodotorula dairenensis]
MPLLAQRLVGQDGNASSPSQQQQQQPLPPSRADRGQRQTTHSPRELVSSPASSARRLSGTPNKQKRDAVFSWTDEMLANKYQFLAEVGFGNWGSVWKVVPRAEPDRTHSVKLVHRSHQPTSAARLRALWTEFKCVRLLESDPHPNLIRFYSFIISPSYALCVMDFHPRLMPISLSEAQARPYLLQIVSAVAHLHKHGITHSDIKPSNILLSKDDRPILIDFGFARHHDVEHPAEFLSSLSWGTPEYLSPERAKGEVHDERLSDVFALGVTMYEIVVGRTPFEETEDESFLNREALVEYYDRTLTGRFWGVHALTPEFSDLIGTMIKPDPRRRMVSCKSASMHPFFTTAVSPPAARLLASASGATSPVLATPERTPKRRARVPLLPSKDTNHPARWETPPQKNPQSRDRSKSPAFVVYEDAPASDASSISTATTSLAPKPLALVERTNLPLQQKARRAPVQAVSLAKTARPAPAPSRIPVRTVPPPPVGQTERDGVMVPSVLHRVPKHQRVASTPLTTARPGPVRSRVISQPLLSQSRLAVEAPEEGRPARQAQLVPCSLKRKPSPSLTQAEASSRLTGVACVPENVMIRGGPKSSVWAAAASLEPAPASLEQKPCISTDFAGGCDEAETPTTFASPPFAIRTRTYTGPQESKKEGSDSPLGVFLSDIPKLSRKTSRALSNGLKKLSYKHVRRAPSLVSLGSNILGSRRRISLADATFEIVEAERLVDQDAHTLPLNLDCSTPKHAEVARARLVSLSRRTPETTPSPHIDPFLISPSGTPRTPSPASRAGAFTGPIEPAAMEDFLRTGAPGFTPALFRPGHRRIPTAIRNTPTVVVHESSDDGDCSVSDCSRTDTPASDARVTSSPRVSRVVAEAQQLPAWVPNDDSDNTVDEADIDEPTIKLDCSPPRLHETPVRISSCSAQPGDRIHSGQSIAGGEQTASMHGSPRPLSTFSNSPFTNLHCRAELRSTSNTFVTSAVPAAHVRDRTARSHKRSRSVMSIFSLFSPNPNLPDAQTGTSNMGGVVSRSTYTVDQGGELVPVLGSGSDPLPGKQKKDKRASRVRKVIGSLFR